MKTLTKGLVVFAGLMVSPGSDKAELPAIPKQDPRLHKLQAFFDRLNCPVISLAEDFLAAADRNGLDWRLLPSISVVESGGGKAFRNNNIFGWDSARQAFPSIRQGIHRVAERLANSSLYKDKDLDGILRTYNPREEYPLLVKSVMRSISPERRAAGGLD
jgi:hypothetical protein